MASPPRRITKMVDAPARAAFIAALKECGMVGASAYSIGFSRFAFYRARERHPAFAEWDRITGPQRPRSAGIDQAALERALFKRVLRGVIRHVVYQGEVVDTYRVFDNRSAFAMLAKAMHATYGPKAAGMPEPVDVMSREEFLAAIAPRPRTKAVVAGDGADPARAP